MPHQPPPPRRVFIRNLVVASHIGVHPHEHGRPQRVRISVELATPDAPRDPPSLASVVDYERLAAAIRAVVRNGHVRLVETLADRIATACLDDPRVETVRVTVEKLDVFEDAESAGVEIERGREGIRTPGPDGAD